MTDDICGEPTSTGSPCQRDPGWGRDVDQGACVDHADGRPSKLDSAWDDAMEAAEAGLTKAGIARYCGIDESTLHRWLDKYDDFRKSLRRKRAQAEVRYVTDPDDTRHAQFLLERSFGYTKSEEVELSGEVDTGGLSSDEKELLGELFDRDPQGDD